MIAGDVAQQIVGEWDDLTDLETRIRLALNSAFAQGAEQQRESDAKLVENYHGYPSSNDYSIAAAIRNNST